MSSSPPVPVAVPGTQATSASQPTPSNAAHGSVQASSKDLTPSSRSMPQAPTFEHSASTAPPAPGPVPDQSHADFALLAAQQQAALQQQLQQAIASGGQDISGALPPQLQQMLIIQQQAIMQQHRHQPQLAQQQAVPTAHGTDVTDSQSIDDWAAEPLFGGAMEMELPMRFHDISKFRPVPDHQEVFADAQQDQSLVIEILEMAKVENERCAHYFFEDLAVQNDAESSAMETVYTLSTVEVPNLPQNSVCTCALGYQTIAKGQQPKDTSNYVQIILGVVRLPQVQSDIVISLSTPAYIHEKSSSAEHAGAGAKTAYLRAPDLFKRMLQSFQILDMGLFGSS